MNAILKVKNITVAFRKKEALKNISCELMASEVIGLVGPNGAGKTTLMKTILGFIRAKEGSIEKNDIKIASLIEQPGLYPFMTGLEHLQMFSDDPAHLELNQLISLLDLSDFISIKSKDYSLGMKQRLGIALALLNKPQLVILDEPMNGLDPYSVKLLKEVIATYRASGVTFLVSSHILSELEKIVDRVLLVKDGRLIEDVDHPELLDNFEDALLEKLAEGVEQV